MCSVAPMQISPAQLGVLSGEASGEAVGLYPRRRVFLAVQGDWPGVQDGELWLTAVLDAVMANLASLL